VLCFLCQISFAGTRPPLDPEAMCYSDEELELLLVLDVPYVSQTQANSQRLSEQIAAERKRFDAEHQQQSKAAVRLAARKAAGAHVATTTVTTTTNAASQPQLKDAKDAKDAKDKDAKAKDTKTAGGDLNWLVHGTPQKAIPTHSVARRAQTQTEAKPALHWRCSESGTCKARSSGASKPEVVKAVTSA
jgi:hypothetical protein